MKAKTHQYPTKYQFEWGSVEHCECGVMQINFGAVSVRLDDEVAQELWDVLGRTLGQRRLVAPLNWSQRGHA